VSGQCSASDLFPAQAEKSLFGLRPKIILASAIGASSIAFGSSIFDILRQNGNFFTEQNSSTAAITSEEKFPPRHPKQDGPGGFRFVSRIKKTVTGPTENKVGHFDPKTGPTEKKAGHFDPKTGILKTIWG